MWARVDPHRSKNLYLLFFAFYEHPDEYLSKSTNKRKPYTLNPKENVLLVWLNLTATTQRTP